MSDTANETPATTAVRLMEVVLSKLNLSEIPDDAEGLLALYKKCREHTKFSG